MMGECTKWCCTKALALWKRWSSAGATAMSAGGGGTQVITSLIDVLPGGYCSGTGRSAAPMSRSVSIGPGTPARATLATGLNAPL